MRIGPARFFRPSCSRAEFVAFLIASAALAGGAYMPFPPRDPPRCIPGRLAEYEPAVLQPAVPRRRRPRLVAAIRPRGAASTCDSGAIPKQAWIAAFPSPAEDQGKLLPSPHRPSIPEGIAGRPPLVTNLVEAAADAGAPLPPITQQVAKNFLLTSEQTYERKIREALIALRMESAFTKDQILELYLNEIFLGTIVPGRNLHGVAAAALDYFDKSVHELTLAESAYLAALPKAPNNYHPFRERENAIGRRNWVLDRMLDNGYITAEEAAAAKEEPLEVTQRRVSPNLLGAGYFVEEARRQIASRFGDETLYEGGLSIRTTLRSRRCTAIGPQGPVVDRSGALRRRSPRQGLARAGLRTHRPRGPPADWGVALAGVRPLADSAALGARPPSCSRSGGGRPHRAEARGRDLGGGRRGARVTGPWPPRACAGRGQSVDGALDVGDVVYVERQGAGSYRLRQVRGGGPAPSSRMDPHTGRVKAMVGGLLLRPEQCSTAPSPPPGVAPAGLVLQALRLRHRARQRLHAVPPSCSTSRSRSPAPAPSPGRRPTTTAARRARARLRYGIERSKNLMTVRLAQDVGMPLVVEYAPPFRRGSTTCCRCCRCRSARARPPCCAWSTGYSMFVNGGKRIPRDPDRPHPRTGTATPSSGTTGASCLGCDAESWRGQGEPELVRRPRGRCSTR